MLQMISTHDLPSINDLKQYLQSLALLDSILSPEWEFRYYSFNLQWDEDTALASIRNGSGDHIFFAFNKFGCLIKGFSHESSMSPFLSEPPSIYPGVINKVPAEFIKYLQNISLIPEETSFCIWKKYSDISWQLGEVIFPDTNDPDGSRQLLSMVFTNPKQYQKWAEEYYEISVEIELIAHVFFHKPLTQDIIFEINPQSSLEIVNNDLQEIGYINSQTIS
jgi:hypothetical protein